MISIGVIGYGYWGPNLVRNFNEAERARVVAVADPRADKRAAAAARYPGIETHADAKDLIARTDVDAVAIATPVSSHTELALAAIDAGKHVLVEKPIASTSEDAARIIEAAAKKDVRLMVDHTFVFTGAVRKIKQLVDAGTLGDIYYYDSARVNLGLFQHDINVIYDLAVHDLSIMDHIVPQRVKAVSCCGMAHVPNEPENIAFLTLFCEGNAIGHIHVNWLAPVKIRRTLIGGSRKMIVYNDLEPSEKVKVYDRGVTVADSPKSVYNMLINYRVGDMIAPQLDITEALRVMAYHFIDCIENKRTPVSDGEAGLRVVKVLEAASESMANRGVPVDL